VPTSPWQPISPIIDLVMDMTPRPRKVLDVGFGFGKWGLLLREYLEYFGQSGKPADSRTVVIDGVEVFPPYIGRIQRAIYDSIYEGDIVVILPRIASDSYDLVMLIDVLEHFDKSQGSNVLKECQRVGKAVIVSTPSGWFAQGAAYGNPYEVHKALWTRKDLKQAGARFVFRMGNWIGVFARPPYASQYSWRYKVNFWGRWHLPDWGREMMRPLWHLVHRPGT